MSREIKFRAWIKEQNRMIKVFGFNEHLVFEQTYNSPSIKENIFEVEETVLMQYTGLKDKNGLDIYEGDIVNSFKKTYEDSVSKNKVEFIEGCWKLICDGKNNIPLFLYKPKELEIIGNIYENPNLLIKNQ